MRVTVLCCFCLLPLLVSAAAPHEDDTAREILGRTLAPTPILLDLEELTDGIGGRPTGSPALDRASDWGIKKFRAAGLENVHAEPYVAPLLWLPGGETGELVEPDRRPLRIAALPFSS